MLKKIYGELKNENNTSASVKQNYIENPEIEEINENENKGQTSTNYQVHNRKKSEKLDDEYIQAANFYSKQYKEFSDRKVKKTEDITGNKRSNRNSERNEAKKMYKWQDKPSENEERIEHISGDQYVYMMNGFDENKITVTKEEEGILLRAEEIYSRLGLEKCSTPEKKYVHQICVKYPFQFFMKGDILGNTTVIQHRIKLLPNTKTINIRQYRIPHFHKKILQDMINDYEEQGIIEKCQSPFNSPAILVGKKDNKGDKTDFRFVVDYRKLNESSELYNFPIPFIDDILDGLSGCKIFTTLDIKGAFHQITLEKSCRDYTAFTAGNFQYRWVRMPMGLSSAPLTWQRANTILSYLIGNGVYVYLDDVIIYAKDFEDHNNTLHKVMQLLKEHNLQLKISKCNFFAKEFEYLGHLVSVDGIKANPKKIEVIRQYPRPKDIKQIQSFLGMINYYRRFINGFARIAKPLTILCKKDQPFIWTNFTQTAFEKLKTILAEEITLAFPNFESIFYVTTDASDIALGGVLSQGDLPNDRPLQFVSKTLTDTQRHYSTIQKELLAIVESIKAFRPYIYGRFSVLITDHKPLCFLFNMKDCGSRLFRQRLELSNYNFKILHRPGSQNSVADALSRIKPITRRNVKNGAQTRAMLCNY